MKFLSYKIKNHEQQGFTLVEFIVIMSIFAIMVGVVLFNFTTFRSRVTLDNLAQDIALSIRQVQTTGGAGITDDPTDPSNERFRGIAFIRNENGNGFEKKFIMYEASQSGKENSAYIENSDEILDTISIGTPDTISDIVTGNSIESIMKDEGSSVGGNAVSIAFQRFNTRAYFSTDDPDGYDASSQYLCIKITSPDGNTSRYVCVSSIGQVSVH